MKETRVEASFDEGEELAELSPEYYVNMCNTYDHTYCYTVNKYDHTYCQAADKYDYIEAVDESEIVIENDVVFENEIETFPVHDLIEIEPKRANETVGNCEKRLAKNDAAQRRFMARETSEQRKERLTSGLAKERKTIECISLSETEESEAAVDEDEVDVEFEAVDVDGIIEIRPKKSTEKPQKRLAVGNERNRLERRSATLEERFQRFAARRKNYYKEAVEFSRETPELRMKRLAAEEREKRRLYIEKHKRIARLEQEKLEKRRAKRRQKLESETPAERVKRLAMLARRRNRVIEIECYARRR